MSSDVPQLPEDARPGVAAAVTSGARERPPLERVRLVPRFDQQGYTEESVAARRAWLEEVSGCALPRVGGAASPAESMRGNVENPVGWAQVPLGVAGPLRVRGEHLDGVVYVPMATTEGAMLRSYERGMVALTRAGGAEARVERDENRVSPVFSFGSVEEASAFAGALPELVEELRGAAEATTHHGKLLRVEPRAVGREVLVTLAFSTGDAHGMNLVARAAHAACERLAARFAPRDWLLMSGLEGEKRAAGALFAGGKGKSVIAGARLPAAVLRAVLHVDAATLARLWRRTAVGHFESGASGCNAQAANALAALFIALGQDVANLANAALAVTTFEAEDDGSLWASVHLPSLTLATVGGGTGVGTAPECLAVLGCRGTGDAPRLAEIVAATVLAGELSFAAALASGEFVASHEQYGRNRPPAPAAAQRPSTAVDGDEEDQWPAAPSGA